MFRFFVSPQNILGNEAIITGEDINHIRKSLRLKKGDHIILCDASGFDYLVELDIFENDQITGKVIEVKESKGEPEIEVTLFQGVPKSDKMDLIVQKSTELGISRIIPVETKRTIVKLNQEKSARRVERWQKIAIEAAKQAQRGKIPEITQILSWENVLEFLQKQHFDLLIVPWEGAKNVSIRQLLKNYEVQHGIEVRKIAYLIGPEGGLEESEVEDFLNVGAVPITLGPRILRTETAGFAVLTILLYEFMQMEGCEGW